MKPINIGGHSAYQNSLVDLLCKYYPDPDMLSPSTWDTIERFYRKDLSRIDELMQDRYSVFGPAPRLPSCMVRSLIVALEFNITSYSTLADALKITPLYAILSGFSPRDTPGVGTFYDFIDRLWLSDSASFNEHIHLPKKKVEKPSGKGDKAASIEKVTVDDLIGEFSSHSPQTDTPFSLIFDIFKELFLDESVERGLIDPSALSVAGDGTPVRTACMERRKRICECDGKCDCPRHYSQPDCDYGWDSHRKCFYFGYDLYLFTYPRGDSDLPIFPALFPASKHDSLAFVHTWFASRSFLPEFHVSKLFLDSAHDAMPIYELCRKNRTAPFIDLNNHRGKKPVYKDDFTLDSDGVPICKAGLRMRHDGVEKKKYRSKFRCPLFNRVHGCSCETPCSDSKYGRTVHLAMKDDPRLINIPPRDSDEWKKEYNARTSSERRDKRIKNDYKLEDGKHRSSKHWYCRLFCVMMCQHLDAWDLPYEPLLKNRIMQVS